MRINCVLFDLDNTLVGIPETWQYFDELIKIVLKEDYQLPIPSTNERDSLWRSGKKYIEILKDWGVLDPNDFWIKFDRRDEIKRKNLIEDGKLILYDDVIPALKKLNKSGIKIGIVSNTPDFIVEYELEAFKLQRYFNSVLGLGDDQSICKPEPDGIIMILKDLNCKPSETLFIGDSEVDLIAAQRASVFPLYINRSEQNIKKLKKISRIDPKKYKKITSLDQIFDLYNIF